MRKIQKEMQHEVLETLASICLWLDYAGHHYHNPHSKNMQSHFLGMKRYSEILRNEILGNNKG